MPFENEETPTEYHTCSECGSKNIVYRIWMSSDEAHEDIIYRCVDCDNGWWIEGSDA